MKICKKYSQLSFYPVHPKLVLGYPNYCSLTQNIQKKSVQKNVHSV